MHIYRTTLHAMTVAALGLASLSPSMAESTGSAVQNDLAQFRSQLFEKDHSFSTKARANAEELLASLEKRASLLSAPQIELGLAEIVAQADNGHTVLLNAAWTHRYNRVPLLFMIAGDRLYIAHSPEQPTLEGREVRSIGGKSFSELEDHWSRYQGGVKGWRREFIYFFIESPEMMHAAGLTDSPDEYRLELAVEGSKPKSILLKGRSDPNPLTGMEAYLPPARALWIHRMSEDNTDTPLYLREPRTSFHYETIEDGKLAYILMRSTRNSETQPIAEFISETTRKLKSQAPRGIVLDMRHNPGGDLNTTRDFMQSLPELVAPEGNVAVLISGRTFSAAVSSVGYLKQAGGDRVIIIGEPLGDRLEFWAEGGLVELSNSGVAFLHATERHNYRDGCPEEDCHRAIQIHPIRVPSLMPDHPIAISWQDFARGHDPLLEKATELLAE